VFATLQASTPSLELFTPQTLLCPGEFCMAVKGGISVYRDSNHLTASFAEALKVLFVPLFVRAN
jgi:hypothetical protein